jgi:hypothetical protein
MHGAAGRMGRAIIGVLDDALGGRRSTRRSSTRGRQLPRE